MDTKALRQKILDLAIRGKLVPQNPNDEPADVLLERIREQKMQMFKEGKLKKKDIKNDTVIFKGEDNLHYEKFQDGTMKCIEAEIPFELPEGWRWSRLGSLFSTITGNTPSTKNASLYGNDYPFYKPTDLEAGLYVYTSEAMVSEKGYQAGRGVPEHSVLITCIGATIGKTGYIRNTGICNQQINAILPHKFIAPEYTYFCMCSDFEQRQIWINSSSTTLPILNKSKFDNLLFPVPPLLEQSILIKEIKKLFQHVNIIQMEKSTLQETLRLTKNKILDLAIRGKLVPQDPNDEPASVLLERIKAEKEELIKQGKIKRDKKESIIFKGDDNSYYEKLPDGKINCIDEQLPFELPDGWKWCNLSMIGTTNIGLTYRPVDVDTQGIIVLRSCNIVNDEINLTDLVRVKTSIRENQFVQKDDILICARNGSRSLVGKCTLIPKFDEKVSFGAFMAVYRTPYFNYIVHFLRSNFFRSVFDDSNSTAINQLTQDMLKRAVVPLPPLAEQLKIVDKITELFERLNCIEESLN